MLNDFHNDTPLAECGFCQEMQVTVEIGKETLLYTEHVTIRLFDDICVETIPLVPTMIGVSVVATSRRSIIIRLNEHTFHYYKVYPDRLSFIYERVDEESIIDIYADECGFVYYMTQHKIHEVNFNGTHSVFIPDLIGTYTNIIVCSELILILANERQTFIFDYITDEPSVIINNDSIHDINAISSPPIIYYIDNSGDLYKQDIMECRDPVMVKKDVDKIIFMGVDAEDGYCIRMQDGSFMTWDSDMDIQNKIYEPDCEEKYGTWTVSHHQYLTR